jgi:hypothetical protein
VRIVLDSDTALSGWAIDALLDCYISWREECRAVWLTYQRWTGSGRDERHLAYAGYLAALDQEEHAARAYADHVDWVRRQCR